MINVGQVEPNALFTIIGQENNTPQRIDIYLAEQFSGYSRSFFQKLIENQYVKRNDTIVTKPSTPIYFNDIIAVQFPPEKIVEPSVVIDKTINVSILAQTEHFMIIYKPAHLLVHAPSKASTAITLTDWILHHHNELAQIGIVDRPGIVHRLDKETSGIMVLTRTNYGHGEFSRLFKERNMRKTYLALVAGHPEKEGTIDRVIGRDPVNRIAMTSYDEYFTTIKNVKVRSAITHYKVLQYFENSSLVEVKPVTGRTHQIRVHMKSIGHPVIGDQLYGEKSPLIDRQALHAHSLSFIFNEQEYTFTCPLPDDFQNLLDNQTIHSDVSKKV